jgi:hypothetical protein
MDAKPTGSLIRTGNAESNGRPVPVCARGIDHTLKILA